MEFSSFLEAAEAIGVSALEGIDSGPEWRFLQTLCGETMLGDFVELRQVTVPTPGGSLGYLVPRTKVFIDVDRCKELRGDLAVAVAIWAWTQNIPAAAAIATMRKMADCIQTIDDSEHEVLLTIIQMSKGRPYDTTVNEAEVLRLFANAPFDINQVLDELQRRKIIAVVRPAGLRMRF